MFSAKSVSINAFQLGNDLTHTDVSKQYFGDLRADVIAFPEYKVYTDDQDLVFDHHDDAIVSVLEGRACTNRLKIGNWNMYTNDDVLTIEHELAHSRTQENTLHIRYSDMYMTDVSFAPSERVNVRLIKLTFDCQTAENAAFAKETMRVHNTDVYDVCVHENILVVALCYTGGVFYLSHTILSTHFLQRSIRVLECLCIDVDGFVLPTTCDVPIFADTLVDDATGFTPNDDDPDDTRYVFRSGTWSGNERYVTEKGFVHKDDFYRKPYKYKYIIVHPGS